MYWCILFLGLYCRQGFWDLQSVLLLCILPGCVILRVHCMFRWCVFFKLQLLLLSLLLMLSAFLCFLPSLLFCSCLHLLRLRQLLLRCKILVSCITVAGLLCVRESQVRLLQPTVY